MMIGSGLLRCIHELLAPGCTILELGSGEGTALLARDYHMVSVEHDPFWVGKYDSHYIYAPIIDGWYDTIMLQAQLPDTYHLLLLDGPPGYIGRTGFLDHLDLFDLTIPIIVDDVQRQVEKTILHRLEQITGRPAEMLEDGIKLFGVLA